MKENAISANNRASVLRRAVDRDRITTDEDLAKSFMKLSFSPRVTEEDRETDFTETARSRVYVLRQFADWLGFGVEKKIVDLGSAGCTDAALALPDTDIYSIDCDHDLFMSNTNNSLPAKYFSAVGRSKTLDLWRQGSNEVKREKFAFIREALPNFHPVVARGERLPFSDSIMDAALIQGCVHPKQFLQEMSRVLKPGGYVVISMEEDERPLGSVSSYDTNVYVSSRSEISMIDGKEAANAGFEKIEIPKMYRSYEDLGTYTSAENRVFSAGLVFQVFRKMP